MTSADDTVRLVFSLMGYETCTFIVPNVSLRKDVLLKEKPFELKEVTVAPPIIWKHGDTLTYNVEKLRSEQDYAIGDVLKKLPGIEVAANGSISYQGKAISKFYIEGLDLMERRYNIATNSIPAEAVAHVQVFENHQPVKALTDVLFSESAALNLLLKNSYKMRPVVDAAFGTGFSANDWLRRADLMMMRIRKDRQSLMTMKLNNTGTLLSADLTEYRIDGLPGGENVVTLFNAESSTVPFEITEPSLFNDSYLGTYNDLFRVNDEAQLRIIASYLNEKGWRDYGLHSDYYIGGDDLGQSAKTDASQTMTTDWRQT